MYRFCFVANIQVHGDPLRLNLYMAEKNRLCADIDDDDDELDDKRETIKRRLSTAPYSKQRKIGVVIEKREQQRTRERGHILSTYLSHMYIFSSH